MQPTSDAALRSAVAIAIVQAKRKREADLSELRTNYQKLESENLKLRSEALNLGRALQQLNNKSANGALGILTQLQDVGQGTASEIV